MLKPKSYKSSLVRRLIHSALRDLLICFLLVLILTLVSIEIDAVELLYQFTREYEDWDLDEVILGLFWFVTIGIFYFIRRFWDYRNLNQTITALAYFDPLTGLPNRLMLQEHIAQAIAVAQRNQQIFFLLYIDVDNFKQVNDTYGHDVGDGLLKSLTQRMKLDVRESDLLVRMGGDEFILLTAPDAKEQNESILVKRLIASQQQKHVVGQHQVSISLSIGIARYPDNGIDVSSLIKCADKAMYQSKLNGKDQYSYVSEDTNDV